MTIHAVSRFVLPYPPSVNTYWRQDRKRGLTFISPEGRNYRRNVAAIVLSERIEPLPGKLALFFAMHPPDRRERDLDNTLKAMLDALQDCGVLASDSGAVVRSIALRWRGLVKGGRVVVKIRQIEAAAMELF